jgi:hypothetical protein
VALDIISKSISAGSFSRVALFGVIVTGADAIVPEFRLSLEMDLEVSLFSTKSA